MSRDPWCNRGYSFRDDNVKYKAVNGDPCTIRWALTTYNNTRYVMTVAAWLVFIAAAALEVGGDAVIRKGLHGSLIWFILSGFVMLGCYGVVVNTVKWDFSRLLGVYVAVFAVISVLTGRFLFREVIPASTWLGLAIIVVGGAVIQVGPGLMK